MPQIHGAFPDWLADRWLTVGYDLLQADLDYLIANADTSNAVTYYGLLKAQVTAFGDQPNNATVPTIPDFVA
jgi:hypothetical protein